VPVVKIADVKVANRYRVNLGDLDGLSASLRNIGQLQPIVITADLRLIAGGRRLAAAQSLGWTEIDAKIASNLIDASDLLRAERDENTCRKAFTPTEEHSLYDALVALEMATQNDVVGRTSGAPSSKVRESIATIVSGNAGRYKTLEKIGEIKSIANDESRPNTVRQAATNALRELDETGNV
jgi:ParB family transcriptional regulator, chromosome partitioning protein